jgi:hypothetical protein
MSRLKEVLSERFGIEHTTIQFECESCEEGAIICQYEPENG